MAPGYRNRDRERDRRQNRTGYVDHDIFEGLPVRHWRRDYVTVAPQPTQDNNAAQNDIWAVELPHGMPKDSHLLAQHSQDLLRAARSGKIYKRPPPAEEEEVDPDILLGDKPEKKEDDHKDKGFTAKAWKQIPRHLEGPDIEYLAKRRKGLVAFVPITKASASTVTRATVKRFDAAGNEYVQDIVIPHGQKVEGEIISQVEIPDPSTSSNDPFAAPTPRKKGPIIRKKSKPIGKSKKKKPVAPTSVPQNIELNGAAEAIAAPSDQLAPDVRVVENGVSTTPANNEDTDMAEGSNAASDEEDGEEGDEDEDGDGNEDDETPLGHQDTSEPSAPHITPVKREHSEPMSTGLGGTVHLAGPWRPDLERESSEIKSGSPLRNVISTDSDLTPLGTPTATTATAATAAPTTATAAPTFLPDIPSHSAHAEKVETVLDTINQEMQQMTAESAQAELPVAPPHPTDAEVAASLEVRLEEEEEEQMLLDLVENTSNFLEGQQVIESESAKALEEIPAVEEFNHTEGEVLEPSAAELVAESKEQMDGDVDDDDFPDLLGSLEKQLNKPVDTPDTSG